MGSVGRKFLWAVLVATIVAAAPVRAAPDDGRLFAAAIAASDAAAVEKLIEEGRDVNATIPAGDGSPTRTTPLILAVFLEQDALVPMLVEAGARADLVDDANRSPLWYATFRQNREMVEYLGALEASRQVVNLPDKVLRQTPLHVAVGLFDPRIVAYLQDIGASASSRNYMGRTVAEVCQVDATEACEGLKP